jgi:hypothetical protein
LLSVNPKIQPPAASTAPTTAPVHITVLRIVAGRSSHPLYG